MKITDIESLKVKLRNKFVFPGGYEIAYVTSDNVCLCRTCIKANMRSVTYSIKNKVSDGFRVDQSFITAGIDGPMYCDNCSKELTGYEGEENG